MMAATGSRSRPDGPPPGRDPGRPPQPPSGTLGLLVSRRFGPLFWTQFLSAFNDNALKNALVLMIAYRVAAPGDWPAGVLIPLAGGLFMLPFFLCSATAGMLADTHDKAWLIRLIKLIEIGVMTAAAAAVLLGHAGWLLFLLLAMGVQAAFFGPLKYAILPNLLAQSELLLGNALVEAGTFLAILLGTVAGMLIAVSHGRVSVAVLILLVALAAWGASRKIGPAPPAAAARGRSDWNLFRATWRLIQVAAGLPTPFRAMLGISWFWLAGAIYLSQFPSYAHDVLHAEPAVVTLFLAVFSVGIGAGSLLCNTVLRGKVSARTVPWGAAGMGLFSVDLWFASPAGGGDAGAAALLPVGQFLATAAHWRLLGDLLGIALAGGIYIVPLYAILQVATVEAIRARIIAANNVINAAAMVIAAVATIALVSAGISVPGLFLLTGLATLGIAAASWHIVPRLAVTTPLIGDAR